MSRCEEHDLLTTTGAICRAGWLVGNRISRALPPAVAISGRPEREGRCGRRAARTRGGAAAAPPRAAMTRDLHHVCAPTPLRRASLGALETASHRRGVLARSMREIDPRARRASWTQALHPTSRASTVRAARIRTRVAGRWIAAKRWPHRAGSDSVHGTSFHRGAIDRRLARCARGACAPRKPCFLGRSARGLVGLRACAGRPRLAACISIILCSQNVTQYTKSTRDCLHELSTLLFSISGELCIGYAE